MPLPFRRSSLGSSPQAASASLSPTPCTTVSAKAQAEEMAVLLSIRPVWVAPILAGQKTVELRRIFSPHVIGATIFLYATRPQQAVVGRASIINVTVASPAEIWRDFGGQAAVAQAEFDAYFSGRSRGYAVQLGNVTALGPLSLAQIRRLRGLSASFRPPQSYKLLAPTDNLRQLLDALEPPA